MYCDTGPMTHIQLRDLITYLRARLSFELNQNTKLVDYLKRAEPGFEVELLDESDDMPMHT